MPRAWQAFGERVLTTDELFELEDPPPSLAVIGLGPIGLELGQSLHRLCVEVTGFDRLTAIAGTQDPDVTACAIDLIRKEFPIHLGQAAAITKEGDKLRVTAGENSVLVDRVLCSISCVPNVEDLGLENLGVDLDDRGLPAYNSNSMQVGNLPVFLAGDVTGERQILHEAGDEGKIAGYNAARDQVTAFRRKAPLFINFCDPNICAAMPRRQWKTWPDRASTPIV